MGDPVVVLELDPGGREQVEERHLLHDRTVAVEPSGEQLAADGPRVRGQQRRVVVTGRSDRCVGDVAQEARARSALLRLVETVPRTVRRPEVGDPWRRGESVGDEADLGPRRVGGAQVVRHELLAHVGQHHRSRGEALAVPCRPHRSGRTSSEHGAAEPEDLAEHVADGLAGGLDQRVPPRPQVARWRGIGELRIGGRRQQPCAIEERARRDDPVGLGGGVRLGTVGQLLPPPPIVLGHGVLGCVRPPSCRLVVALGAERLERGEGGRGGVGPRRRRVPGVGEVRH